MKMVIKIAITGLFMLMFWGICSAGDFTFRKTKWGMTEDEVKASEPLETAEENERYLAYKTSVIGKDVFVVYFFIDNQLTRARYVLADSHSNKNDFITDYEDFKAILIKKYGNPVQDDSIWKNDLYKDDYSDWGTAISIGHLVYFSNWKTNDTEISNMLMGENYDLSCIVEYCSINFKEIEKKAQDKKALDEF
ncbi:MAG: hypothetical protein P9L92_08655 [Candidatus Electryonea clarkiae]|nr:hypothetical protein [Candidatus Electryonea clarkiae]MDP8288258.1 hypothetical protein [Candidatus Electryonea clarkiae]